MPAAVAVPVVTGVSDAVGTVADGAGVLVGGTSVLVGGTGVLVGGTGVSVGGTGVLVGATGACQSSRPAGAWVADDTGVWDAWAPTVDVLVARAVAVRGSRVDVAVMTAVGVVWGCTC